MVIKSIIIYPGDWLENIYLWLLKEKLKTWFDFFLIYVGVIYKTTKTKGGEWKDISILIYIFIVINVSTFNTKC